METISLKYQGKIIEWRRNEMREGILIASHFTKTLAVIFWSIALMVTPIICAILCVVMVVLGHGTSIEKFGIGLKD
jgi:hypothetical protein